MRLDSSRALGIGTRAIAQIVEWLIDGIEEVIHVLLHDSGLLHVNTSDVALDDIGVVSTELSKMSENDRRLYTS
jgi:hypothetical protein